ncbi:nitroreductase [bacterium BFN5]|nr:nitroreductase [bacterium BFN5]QJW45854.1 nitroreductase [bacterium BFN5]
MLTPIMEWKSIRKFLPQIVPEEKILSVLQAARRAPSWKNIQPWRFIAITQEADKLELASAFSMGGLIKKAPVSIICIGRLDAWERTHQRERLGELLANNGVKMADEEIDKNFLDHDIAKALAAKSTSLMARTFENMGIAYGFMILEAMNQGLGACIVGEIDNELSGVNNKQYHKIKTYFGLTSSEIITAAIILGYPAKDAPVSPRKIDQDIFSLR